MADHDAMTQMIERAGARDPVARRELLRQVERGLFGREAPLPRVGRYTLERRIGSGGQGVVYVAHDPELDRRVAVKLLLSGHAGDENRQRRSLLDPTSGERDAIVPPRLLREAQAMAKLSHPNVAAVYEVGWHDDTAFIAMELVDGLMLRDWLNDRPRRRDEILDVMIQAGRGLAAAHARELVHRDFKPHNVMVTREGVAKVLDFGLATLERQETDSGPVSQESPPSMLPLTETGTVMGTPAYMAPEQRDGGTVDARSDQFAYCVVLHEALWGHRPQNDREAGTSRRGVPSWLAAAMRRGLAVDPAQRWPSMDALLQVLDVGRRRPRARRAAVAAGSVLAIAALAIAGAGVWGVDAVQRSRALAACEHEAAAITEVFDEARADRIAAAFEATGIAHANDTWSRARVRLADSVARWQDTRSGSCQRGEVEHTLPVPLLEASSRCLDEQRDELDALLLELEQPDAGAVNNAGTAIASLPRPEACADEARLRQQEEPPSDPELRERVTAVRGRLARVGAAIEIGRYQHALAEADSTLKEAREIEWQPLVAQALLMIGIAHTQVGHYDDALASLQEAFFSAGSAGRDDIAFDAATMLVSIGSRQARLDDALHWGRLAQMLQERLVSTDDHGALLNNLGLVHHRRGDHIRALELIEQGLAAREAALGPNHPGVATILNSLAIVRRARGEDAQALAAYERALSIREEALGPDHPDVAMSLANLGAAYSAVGDRARARELHERALAIRQKALGPDHPDVGSSFHNLGLSFQIAGEDDRAIEAYERALAIWEKALGPDHPDVATGLNNLAGVFVSRREYERAIAMHERALEIRERSFGREHPDVAQSLEALGLAYHHLGDLERALELYERALAILRTTFGEEHPRFAHALDNAGGVYLVRGDYERAGELIERALRIREKVLAPEHPDLATSREHLERVRAAQADGNR